MKSDKIDESQEAPTMKIGAPGPRVSSPVLKVGSSGGDKRTTRAGGGRSTRGRGPAEERYTIESRLGQGGVGEVWRVWDARLHRSVALKMLRTELAHSDLARSRFVHEAQVMAQLQHPGIIPIYDQGSPEDRRPWYTMKEVHGQTLAHLIREVHVASSRSGWGTTSMGWTLRRLIEVFHQVCQAMAYSHSRGVLHRDLKPANIMVGAFGEVLVMDWGLARVMTEPRSLEGGGPSAIITWRDLGEDGSTLQGTVEGTPSYMPPEQLQGDIDRLGPSSDVYALGATLYHLLTGVRPLRELDGMTLVHRLQAGPPPSVASVVSERMGPEPPPELVSMCERAMARVQSERFSDAEELARAVADYLEGALRRERAQTVLHQADRLPPEQAELRQQASHLRAEAAQLLAGVAPWEGVERKLPAWEKEDRALALEREADLKELDYVQRVHGSLLHDPELPDTHERLAAYYRQQHALAESQRDEAAAARLEVLLRSHDRAGRWRSWLSGDGAVTLWTDPPGAEVSLFQYVPFQRRLVQRFVKHLGRTPLRRVSLPRGSWLLRVQAPGRVRVDYPVLIRREEHWDGVRPGASEPTPIYLPRPEELGEGDIYVPAGWAMMGGDRDALGSIPGQRVWVDGFVLRRFSVTNGQYLAFLNGLLKEGREEEAWRHVPRERGHKPDEPGMPIFRLPPGGVFELGEDEEGELWRPEEAVTLITWESACALAQWEARRTQQPWRLLWELEWEKAARGVDGRLYPWGDFFDATWACVLESHRGRPAPPPVDTFPVDTSVYGARNMAGNVVDWCLDVYSRTGPVVSGGLWVPPASPSADPSTPRTARGGSWMSPSRNARCAYRIHDAPGVRHQLVGMRIGRSLRRP